MYQLQQIQIISTPNEVQGWIENAISSAFQSLSLTSGEIRLPTQSKLLTGKQICDEFSISLPSLIRWRKKGRVPFLKIGAAIRYDRNAVMAALENKKVIR